MTRAEKQAIERRFYEAVMSPEREQRARTPDDPTGYIGRHATALHTPRLGFESALSGFVVALKDYAVAHEQRYESKLADDGVLGDDWQGILRRVRGLLNGELGRLDGGFLDGALCNLYAAAGFDPEERPL